MAKRNMKKNNLLIFFVKKHQFCSIFLLCYFLSYFSWAQDSLLSSVPFMNGSLSIFMKKDSVLHNGNYVYYNKGLHIVHTQPTTTIDTLVYDDSYFKIAKIFVYKNNVITQEFLVQVDEKTFGIVTYSDTFMNIDLFQINAKKFHFVGRNVGTQLGFFNSETKTIIYINKANGKKYFLANYICCGNYSRIKEKKIFTHKITSKYKKRYLINNEVVDNPYLPDDPAFCLFFPIADTTHLTRMFDVLIYLTE
jgi:hypothetical protein